MLKKVIPIVVSLCLIFGISVMAESTNTVNNETVNEVSEDVQNETAEVPQKANENTETSPSGDMQNRGNPPAMRSGEIPAKGANREQRPAGNFTPPQNAGANAAERASQNAESGTENTENPADNPEANGQNAENPQFGGRMPGGMQGGFPGGLENNNQQTEEAEPMTFGRFVKTYSTPIISVILLAVAFIFVIFYRRKNY